MNNKSRTHNSILNVTTGILSQALLMILSFFSRTLFIKFLAVEYLGINSLFTNILTILSLAELGVGSAITYSLYKPLANKDEILITSIVHFYRKIYIRIGLAILIFGVALIPFLDALVPIKPVQVKEDIRVIYSIFLVNASLSYFFSHKISLLFADQKSAINTKIGLLFNVFQTIIQIFILFLFKDFILYLLVNIVFGFSLNYYLSKKVDKLYPFLKQHESIDIKDIKKSIIINAKASFLNKIAGAIMNGTDNIFINYFVGLALLGKFSNYVMLIALVNNFTAIIFSNINASLANLVVTENKEKQRKTFLWINFITFWIFGILSIILYFIINLFITIWLGSAFLLPKSVSLILVINFFMIGIQSSFWSFKSVYGLFKEGQYVVLITATLNLILSYLLGEKFGIVGVLSATALSRLITNFWYDPYIVIKKALQIDFFKYFFKYLKYVFVVLLTGVCVNVISSYINSNIFFLFVINIILVLFLFNFFVYILFRNTDEYKESIQKIIFIKSILFTK